MKSACYPENSWRCLVFALVWILNIARADGIPEPSIVLYGQIQNLDQGQSTRIIDGSLTWTFKAKDGSYAFTVTTNLVNLNDQFSYVLSVPMETTVPGFTPAANALRLSGLPIAYDLSEVALQVSWAPTNLVLSFTEPPLQALSLTPKDRGRLLRIDLQYAGAAESYTQWCQRIFGHWIDPLGDEDGDGFGNESEYRAGTDPKDRLSLFAFIGVSSLPRTGDEERVAVEWSSVAGKKYTLQRSSDLTSGFTNVVAGVAATPPKNTYQDATVAGKGPFFYRLRLE